MSQLVPSYLRWTNLPFSKLNHFQMSAVFYPSNWTYLDCCVSVVTTAIACARFLRFIFWYGLRGFNQQYFLQLRRSLDKLKRFESKYWLNWIEVLFWPKNILWRSLTHLSSNFRCFRYDGVHFESVIKAECGIRVFFTIFSKSFAAVVDGHHRLDAMVVR